MTHPRYAISIIGMKRPQGTKEAVETMFKQSPPDCHFFLTSNGCPDTAAVFDAFAASRPNVTVTHNATNEGFQVPHARHFNLAARMGCEYFLCGNDDIMVPADWLGILSAPMEADPLVAITGPEGNCSQLNHEFHGQPGRVEYIECSCALIRISAIRSFRQKLWCDGLRFCYGEDSSLSLAVREKGFSVKTVPMHVNHLRSVTINSNPEAKRLCMESQEYNHGVNKRRWSHYLRTRHFSYPILIKRKYAIGDVLLVTPIVDAIAKSNPLSPIWIETDYPELFANNPKVQRAAKQFNGLHVDVLVVDLNDTYETTTQTHIIDAYAAKAREIVTGMGEVDLKTSLFPSKADFQWAEGMKRPKMALINTDHGDWQGKNYPIERLRVVADALHDKGFTVMTVGSRRNPNWNYPSLVGKTSLMQLAALCSHASLMVTPDSFPLHCAQAMGCPVVGIYGVTRARFIATQGSKHVGVESDPAMENSGLRHKIAGLRHVAVGAETMLAIQPEQILEAVRLLEL